MAAIKEIYMGICNLYTLGAGLKNIEPLQNFNYMYIFLIVICNFPRVVNVDFIIHRNVSYSSESLT